MTASTRLTLDATRAPAAEDIAHVRDGLRAFNDSQPFGPATVERVAVFLRDANGTIHGGLVGFLAWQWLSVEWLWVAEPHRGQGYGSVLLRQAEALARDAGCVAVKLDTYEFQARPFYEKAGYVVYGILEGFPANTRTYYLRKAL